MTFRLFSAFATAIFAASPVLAQSPPPAPLPIPLTVAPPAVAPPPYLPFANLPFVPLDEPNNGIGIAQKMTRERGLQARLMWIDATANLEKVNTAEKIAAIVAQLKAAGFNTIVFEVKPIVGQTLYPSKFAPKLTEWRKPGLPVKTMPVDFDPLRVFVDETRRQGMGLIASVNAFSEGHRDFHAGPGYDNPDWQSVLYEEQAFARFGPTGTANRAVYLRVNELPDSAETDAAPLALYTSGERLATDLGKRSGTANTVVVILDARGTVVAQTSGGAAFGALSLTLPPGGAALVGIDGKNAAFLRGAGSVGQIASLDTAPAYVRIGDRPRGQVPLITNPFREDVRARLLAMLTEIATNYEIDGITFDDRLRFAGIDADFSPEARRAFETWANAGKPLRWPGDVLRFSYDWPGLARHETPGPYYDAWLVFRALTLRNFLADAVRAVKIARPAALVATYVGSWYPDYPDIGANWAADDFAAGFRFLTPAYRQTGWAGIVDFVTTGCYYRTASIFEANAAGDPVGETVEAAGQFSNRAVDDQTFVYAGISASDFAGRPDALRKVLQAAGATTQGIMVFDYSHNIAALLPVFAEAFNARPAVAPHATPGALAALRAARSTRPAPTAPVILYRGTSGTGF